MVEFALEFFKGSLQGAVPGFLHAFRDQLVVAARLVQADPAANQYLHAFLRLEAQQLVAVAEHGAPDLGTAVLESEIQVAGRGAGEVGEFSLEPDARQALFQQLACCLVQPGDRVDVPFRGAGPGFQWCIWHGAQAYTVGM